MFELFWVFWLHTVRKLNIWQLAMSFSLCSYILKTLAYLLLVYHGQIEDVRVRVNTYILYIILECFFLHVFSMHMLTDWKYNMQKLIVSYSLLEKFNLSFFRKCWYMQDSRPTTASIFYIFTSITLTCIFFLFSSKLGQMQDLQSTLTSISYILQENLVSFPSSKERYYSEMNK